MVSTWLLQVNYKRIRVGFVLVSLDLISNVENVILGTFSKTLEVSTVWYWTRNWEMRTWDWTMRNESWKWKLIMWPLSESWLARGTVLIIGLGNWSSHVVLICWQFLNITWLFLSFRLCCSPFWVCFTSNSVLLSSSSILLYVGKLYFQIWSKV